MKKLLIAIVLYAVCACLWSAEQVYDPVLGKLRTLDIRVPTTVVDGQVVVFDGTSGRKVKAGTTAGTGDFVGPAASVDNEIVRFDGITGKAGQAYTSGGPTVSDTGVMTLLGASPIVFDGATAGTFTTTIAITDPTTPNKTITFQNASGIVVTDATACTDLEGVGLTITAGVLNVDDAYLLNNGDTATGDYDFTGAVLLGASPLVFEGLTADAFETTLAVEDPTTPDKVVTIPNLTGKLLVDTAPNTGNVVILGTLNLGADDDTSTLTIHHAGTQVFYDASDDTSVTIGPVADGTTTLGVTGTIDATGLKVGGAAVLTAEVDGSITNELPIAGYAIDISGTPASTVAFDPTEVLGSITWGDASTDTIVWTWNRATGTDVTMTIASGAANFNGLQVGGVNVLTAEADSLATVTARGATSTQSLTLTGATPLALGEDAATNTAGYIKMFAAGANAYYNTFTSGENTANATYTLPVSMPPAGALLRSNSSGVMTWSDESNFLTLLDTRTRWMPIPSVNFTATPASTSTITMSVTAGLAVGLPIKYAIGGTTYYGVATAVAADTLLTIAGAPLGGNITALYVGNPEMAIQADFFISGTYGNGTGDLLAADMKTYFRWNLGKAYLVSFHVTENTVDTGAEPKINVKVNAAAVSTNDTNKGLQLTTAGAWVSTVVDINTTNYDINRAEAIEINCTEAGGTGDATGLTVSCTFILE